MCLAVPGRIVSLATDAAGPCARVDFAGIEKQVSLAFVPEARIGEYVLVHVGFAIAQVDEAEALRVFEYLREIDALAEELGP